MIGTQGLGTTKCQGFLTCLCQAWSKIHTVIPTVPHSNNTLNLRHGRRVFYQKTEGKQPRSISLAVPSGNCPSSREAGEGFGRGCTFVSGAAPGLCCPLIEQMTSPFKPSFTFRKKGIGKPCTGHCWPPLFMQHTDHMVVLLVWWSFVCPEQSSEPDRPLASLGRAARLLLSLLSPNT